MGAIVVRTPVCVCVGFFQVASYMRAVNDVYDNVDFGGIKLVNFQVKSLRVRTLIPRSAVLISTRKTIF